MRTKLVLAWFVLGGLIVSITHAFTIGPSGNIGGSLQNAVIQSNHIFVGEWRNLRAYDLSAPDLPPQVGSIELTASESALATYDKFALLNTGEWLALVDLTNPTQMSETSRVAVPPATSSSYRRIMVDGYHAFLLADNRKTMAIVDLTQPAAPAMVNAISYSNLIDVAVSSGRIYLLYTNLLKVFDYAQPTNLVELASSPLSFEGRNIVVQGPNAYIGTTNRLRIVNVSNPTALVELGTFSTKKWVMQTILQGGYAYLAVGEYSLNQFVVADVSNPALPVGKYTNNISGSLKAFCVGGAYAAISVDNNSMVIFDISNPAQIRQKSVMPFIGDAVRAWISERAIFVPALNGVLAYDLANPTHPAFASQVDLGFGLQKLVTTGNRLYGWQSYTTIENSQLVDKSIITVADFTNLKAITQLGTFALTRKPSQMLANGTRLFLAGATNPVAGWLEIHDVTNPAAAIRLTDLPLTGTPMALFVDSNWLMVAVTNRVEVYDISTPTAPRLVSSTNVSGAIATCLWAGNGQLLAGSIPQSMFATNWWLDAFTVAANGTLTKIHGTNGNGAIWSVTKIQDTIFTGIMGGSTECYTLGPSGVQLVAVCHSPSTIGLTVISPNTTGVGYVYSIEGYKYYYGAGEWGGYANYGIYIQTYDPREEPPGKGVLITEVEPSEAIKEKCTAEPANTTVNLNQSVSLLATEGPGWNFVEWTGAASGTSKSTTVQVTEPEMLAIAHFVKPTLTLGGALLTQGFCPLDPRVQDEITVWNLTLTVNEVAAWMVDDIAIKGSGVGGDEARDIKAVRLYTGNALLSESTYSVDDGSVSLGIHRKIEAGATLPLRLVYLFDETAVRQGPYPRNYAMETRVIWVGAKPVEPPYPNFVKFPPDPIYSGPTFFAPVWNVDTQLGYGTIQAGVDDPRTLNGHTLEVCPGVYAENVQVNKSLTIRSRAGALQTRITAPAGDLPVFRIQSTNCVVEGFDISGVTEPSVGAIQAMEGAIGGKARKNILHGNYHGIYLTKVSDWEISENQLLYQTADGIALYETSKTRISKNHLRSNQGHGILIEGQAATNNVIVGNLIGTDETGMSDYANLGQANRDGIHIKDAPRNMMGGLTPSDRNLISGNLEAGIEIEGSTATGNVIRGNYIGTNREGKNEAFDGMGNKGDGIFVNGSPGNLIGGTEEGAGNLIAGNEGHGVHIAGSSASGNLIQGNFFGTDPTGQMSGVYGGAPLRPPMDLWNRQDGIHIEEAPGTIIGGLSPQPGSAPGNLISGSVNCGIQIRGIGASGTLVQGNVIGTDITGTQKLCNLKDGVRIQGAINNLIGGTEPGARNVISGNGLSSDQTVHISGVDSDQLKLYPGAGVLIAGSAATGNRIQGNYIGCDASGTKQLFSRLATVLVDEDSSNFGAGVKIEDAPGNTVGGLESTAGNLISGNLGEGILLSGPGASNNVIQGNQIGVDITGAAPLGNDDGVILESASWNLIGGTNQAAGNVIAFNGRVGARQSNRYADGVVVGGASYNQILNNIIRSNAASGVVIDWPDEEIPDPTIGNTIRKNSIFGNGKLGIDLVNDGVTANDKQDIDRGPNRRVNYPVILSAAVDEAQPSNLRVEGVMQGTPEMSYELDFYSNTDRDASGFGEGEFYLDTISVTTDTNGYVHFILQVPSSARNVVATATDPEGNTSEFSTYNPLIVNTTGDEADANPNDDVADVDLSRPGLQTTLRSAIQLANKIPGPDVIRFDIPVSGVPVIKVLSALPNVQEALTIDATSQGNLGASPRGTAGQVELDGTSAGAGSDGLRFLGGTNVVGGLIIRSFGGNGLWQSSNGLMHAERIHILRNQGMGILSRGAEVHVNQKAPGLMFGSAGDFSLIQSNGVNLAGGGIWCDSKLLAETLLVSHNQGPGLFAVQDIELRKIQVLENAGPGIQSFMGKITFLAIAEGDEDNYVLNNEGPGIVAGFNTILDALGHQPTGFGKGIEIWTSVQVQDNAGWGIFADGGEILLNKDPRYVFTPMIKRMSDITGNGVKGKPCRVVSFDAQGNRVLVTMQPLMAGGIGAKTSGIEAHWVNSSTNWSGPGLVAYRDIHLVGAMANDNQGPGIQSLIDSVIIDEFTGVTNQVNNNAGSGVVAGVYGDVLATTGIPSSQTDISIRWHIEIRDNGGWGLYAGKGSISLNYLDGVYSPVSTNYSRITGNGNPGKANYYINQNGILKLLTDTGSGGMMAIEGSISARRIDVSQNTTGPGLIASSYIELGDFKINQNGGPGIQSYRGRILADRLQELVVNEVMGNSGPGIISGALVSSKTLAQGTLGGQKGITIATAVTVRDNAGWGIYADAGPIEINVLSALPETPWMNSVSSITRNGNRAIPCYGFNVAGRWTQLHDFLAGGIGAAEKGVLAYRVEVSENALGPGIAARGDIDLRSFQANQNGGPGIQSLEGLITLGSLPNNAETNRVNGNSGPGILAGTRTGISHLGVNSPQGQQNITILSDLEVKNNAHWGIFARNGSISLNTVQGQPMVSRTSLISGNGNSLLPAYFLDLDGVWKQAYDPNLTGGLGADLGSIQASRAEVTLNHGLGLIATFNIQLFSGKVCKNTAGDFVAGGQLLISDQVVRCDSETDGIADELEALAPNGGDGNRDGIPDQQQSNVASFPSANAGYVTVAAGSGTVLSQVANVPPPGMEGLPSGASLPIGLVHFQVQPGNPQPLNAMAQTRLSMVQSAAANPQHVQVQLFVPDGIQLGTFYQYGPTPDQTNDHWYAFAYDGTTGAIIQSNRIVLHYIDGQRGDHDLLANGIIQALGGPIVLAQIRLKQVQKLAGGQIQFLIEATAGQTYDVEVSTNLVQWSTLLQTNAPANEFPIVDPTAPAQRQGFYRAVQTSGP
jgi:hypothetical protein